MGSHQTVQCPHCKAVLYVRAFEGKDVDEKCTVCKGAYVVKKGPGDSYLVEVV